MREFGVGGVLGDTVANVIKRPLLHFGFALFPSALSAFIGHLLLEHTVQSAFQGSSSLLLAMFGSPLYYASMIATIFCQGWGLCGIIGSLLKLQEGREIPFSDLASIAMENIGKFLVLSVVIYVTFLIGWILLLIPGLIIITMWSAAIPAMVDGELGPWQALKQSQDLTKGKRLKTFVTILVVAIVLGIPSLAISISAGYNPMTLLDARLLEPWRYGAISTLTGTVMTVVMACYLAALYQRLQGGVSGELVATFG